MKKACLLALVALVVNSGCGPSGPAAPDAGAQPPLPDSSLDAGVPDAGADADAGTAADAGVDGACGRCSSFGSVTTTGNVGDAALTEISGLVASLTHPGVLYAHNDSGDGARFFAMSEEGAPLGQFRLPGVTARDWEDIALGPCPTGMCLFLGDIGDNFRVRTDYAVYRVAEPDVEVTRPAGTVDVAFQRLPYVYPGGEKHNAETLLAHPITGDLYVVTKRPSGLPSAVYRFPQPFTPGEVATLIKIADLSVPAVDDPPLTGGDFHPCGTALLLRTYSRLYQLQLSPGADLESIFSAPAEVVPSAVEQQGEAVAWASDGRAYFTVSEGSAQPIHRAACQ